MNIYDVVTGEVMSQKSLNIEYFFTFYFIQNLCFLFFLHCVINYFFVIKMILLVKRLKFVKPSSIIQSFMFHHKSLVLLPFMLNTYFYPPQHVALPDSWGSGILRDRLNPVTPTDPHLRYL